VVNTSATQRRDELQQQQQGDISCGGSDKPLEVAQIEVQIIVRAPPGKLGLTLTNKLTNNQIILMNKTNGYANSGAYVSHVDNDSVLVQQVSKGDSIISIDGIDVSQHTCKQVQSILKSNNLERVLVFAKDISITNAPWYYVDPQGRRQGPFSGVVMRQWLEAGFFDSDLLISQSNSGPFLPLKVYFPPQTDKPPNYLTYLFEEEEEKKKQTVSWLLQCMQYKSEVGSIRRTDTWDNEEKTRLLLGIYLFGYGKWKSIQLVVSTRTNDQVGQKANEWCSCMSTIEETGALSTKEDVLEFYKQTLPKVESIIHQLEKKNHNDKEVNKKRWQELCAQGSNQAQQLLPYESESASSSSTVSFNLGSTHSITTNLDTRHINLDYAKSIFQSYMIRELDGRLEPGTTVSVTNIIRRTEKKRVWAEVEYKVVKIEDSKLPAPVVSSSASSNNSTNKITVKGYTFPPSVNARYHVSLRDLLKMYGEASLQHLYKLNEVASLDTAKRVDLMGRKNSIRRRGGVYSFKINKASPSSLPLSPIQEEEEFIGENEQTVEEEYSDDVDEQSPEEEEFSDDDDEPEDENEEEDKHGMTGSFGGRHDWYLVKGKNGEMYIRIDGEDLSIEGDAGLCKLYDLLMNDVKNDLRIPPWIKRALCIKLHELGGDRFGAKKNTVYLLLEMALQLKDGHSVPGEMFQWDDTVFIGMVTTKLMEALEALEPLFAHFPKLRDVITAAMMSWPPCKDEDDRERVYNKPTATEYTGVDSMRDAFDGPANPDAKTHEERYSIAYNMKQFNSAIDEIINFVQEALKCVRSGCVFLLDKNDLACDETRNNLHDIITSHGFKKVASVRTSK